MNIELHHIAIIVSDIERARKFYSDILGFREIERPNFFIKGIWYDLGKFQLHLMLHEDSECQKPHPLCKTVKPHFALTLSKHDMDVMVNKLLEEKISIIDDSSSTECRDELFFHDYDGNLIELNARK